MKKRLIFGFGLVMLCGMSGCSGSSAEGILKEQVAEMNNITTLLQGIKDDASADAAMPKIEKSVLRIKELDGKLKDLKMPVSEKKRLEDQYVNKEIPDAASKMQAALVQAMTKAPKKAMDIAAILKKAK